MTITALIGIFIGTIGASFVARVVVAALRGTATRTLVAHSLIAAGFLTLGTVVVLGHGKTTFAWPAALIGIVLAGAGTAMIAAAARGRVHS